MMLKLLYVQVMPELNAIMSSFELCAAVVEVTVISDSPSLGQGKASATLKNHLSESPYDSILLKVFLKEIDICFSSFKL